MKETYQDKLANNLLYVRFSLSMWSAKVRDTKEARDSEDLAGAERKTRSVWRKLCTPEIAAIHSKGRALRKLVDDESYSMGLLSGIHKDTGKVFTSQNWDRVKPILQELIGGIAADIKEFCKDNETFTTMVERDMKRHGKNGNRNDYPGNVDDLKEKFLIELNVGKFSVGQTMLFDIMDKSIENIEKESEKRAKKIVDDLNNENFKRIKEPLIKLKESLENYGKSGSYFKQATLDEVDRIVDVMGGFNFSDDPRVKAVIEEVKNSLNGLDGQALRDSAQDRAMVSGTADRIVEKIDAYF